MGEQHLRTYNSIEGVEVVAICDQDPNKLKTIQKSYIVDHAYSDYQKITESSDIDIVSICSYDDCHAEHCISAFRNGKHVMVEKPVTLNRPESIEVLKAQQDSGKFI